MSNGQVTSLLGEITAGNDQARNRLFSTVYDEIRTLARAQMAGQRNDHTLQPTALVNEALLRILGGSPAKMGRNSAEFFALAARAMRTVLVDHARRRQALKRPTGNGRTQVSLGDFAEFEQDDPVDILALDEALNELRRRSERQYNVVMLRFFGGLSFKEIATHMAVSVSTIEKDWYFCRAWLRKRMAEESGR